MSTLALPSLTEAASNPIVAAEVVQSLVRESLDEDFRLRHSMQDADLGALSDLLILHLEALGGGDAGHEEACTSCMKLARNLSVNCPHAQEFWWKRDVPSRIAARVRADMALPDQRSAAWCAAVPGFLMNSVTGHNELRESAIGSWFPHEMSAVCCLCWQRPELAFMFMQNLIGAQSDELPSLAKMLLDREEGHLLIFLLMSLCCSGETSNSDKVWEWAAVFFNTLWSHGGFDAVYRGVKRLTATKIHSFLCESMLREIGGNGADEPPLGLANLVSRLCGHAEALGLLWHSIQGLLVGSDGQAGGPAASALAEKLLTDPVFVKLASEEMASTLARLTFEWQVDWVPEVPSEEASNILGLAEPHEVDALTLSSLSLEAGGRLQSGGRAAVAQLFGEVVGAASALVLASRSAGIALPPRLIGTYLVANVACLDALHRLRFGDLSKGACKDKKQLEKAMKEAAEVSQACHHLEQLRLCGSVLYENRTAQDFLRLSGGLRVLLSNCYADEFLPMLRENGIFAIRNATLGNPANQAEARRLLEERKIAAASGEGPPVFNAAEEIGLA